MPETRLGPAYLQSRIAYLGMDQQRAIRRRLRLRLGAISANKLVSGRDFPSRKEKRTGKTAFFKRLTLLLTLFIYKTLIYIIILYYIYVSV